MTTRDRYQKLARTLQRVCEDELGVRPKYTLCLELAEREMVGRSTLTREEQACRLLEEHRQVLSRAS